MKTNFKGTLEHYKKIFNLVDNIKDELWDMGMAISDMPYFVSDKTKIMQEKNIYSDVEDKINEIYDYLNVVTEENRKYSRHRKED